MSEVTNVRALPGVQVPSSEPNPQVVGMCRKLLDMAEDGRLQSFVGTGFTADGARLALWADTHGNVYEMLGAIGWLQHEYVNRHTESSPR